MFPRIGSIEIQNDSSISITTENESELDLFQARQCQNSDWNNKIVAAIEQASNVNPYNSIPLGSVIPTVDAVDWSGQGDIRPRLWDKEAGLFRLIDSGSMISATTKLPSDKEDKSVKLVAVNGSSIKNGSNLPCKAKRRPIIANKAKAGRGQAHLDANG